MVVHFLLLSIHLLDHSVGRLFLWVFHVPKSYWEQVLP